jgi:hypothetical protein
MIHQTIAMHLDGPVTLKLKTRVFAKGQCSPAFSTLDFEVYDNGDLIHTLTVFCTANVNGAIDAADSLTREDTNA